MRTSENESSEDQHTKHKPSKKRQYKNETSSEDNSTKDTFLQSLNETATKTSRDLKRKQRYKLLSIKVKKEDGYGGTKNNKAVGVFQHPKKENKKIAVISPKPIANFNKKIIKEMNKRISQHKNPYYTVTGITSKKRPDSKGYYDAVNFKWT